MRNEQSQANTLIYSRDVSGFHEEFCQADLSQVSKYIIERDTYGARFSIVVVAEGAKPVGGAVSVVEEASGTFVERLGGMGPTENDSKIRAA